jgi:hypothetical protein
MELSALLGQENTLIHARAEAAGVDLALRGRFDFATSRAVAPLAVLCEYCLPLCGSAARCSRSKARLRGRAGRRPPAVRLLGGGEPQASLFAADGSGRTLIVVPKAFPTPKQYPRQRVKLAERPL